MHTECHHGHDVFGTKLSLMKIERQIDIGNDVFVTVKTEFHIAIARIPLVDLIEKFRTVALICQIAYVVDFDFDKAVGICVFANSNHDGHRLVVFKLVAHVEVGFCLPLFRCLALLVIPFVSVEFRLDGIMNAHQLRFLAPTKSVKESHFPLHICPASLRN